MCCDNITAQEIIVLGKKTTRVYNFQTPAAQFATTSILYKKNTKNITLILSKAVVLILLQRSENLVSSCVIGAFNAFLRKRVFRARFRLRSRSMQPTRAFVLNVEKLDFKKMRKTFYHKTFRYYISH